MCNKMEERESQHCVDRDSLEACETFAALCSGPFRCFSTSAQNVHMSCINTGPGGMLELLYSQAFMFLPFLSFP